MRRLLLLLALIAAPALAGTRATYAGRDGGRVIVEVADNGDARIGAPGAGDYGLLVAGHFHVVGQTGGRLTVARAEDVAAAIDRVVPPIFRGLLQGAPAATDLKLEEVGTAEVAGRSGRRYRLANDPGAGVLVVSDDPALRPVGAALEGFTTAAMLPMAALLGPAAAGAVKEARALFALGTPLEMPDGLRLTGVETVDVPAGRVRLPAAPMDVDTLVAEMRKALPR